MFQTTLLTLFFSLLSFAMAENAAATTVVHGNAWRYGSGGGIIGFIVLILDIIVFMEVLKSNRAPSHKLLWCVVVFFFPIIGLILYYLFSNRTAHMGSGEYEAIP